MSPLTIIAFILIILIVSWIFGLRKTRGRKRRKPAFKKQYGLDSVQPIKDFERKMANGMFQEGKEVFVTAFCNHTHVLKVTANIGSKHSCRPTDEVSLWALNARKNGANNIRQYHNHPHIWGRSFPSSADKRSHRDLHNYLKESGIRFESLLVYKSWFGGHRIKKYG